MSVPDIIIAIDGYSSTGKSSFARKIAAELGFLYLDSGALYRGVTLFALEHGMISHSGEIDRQALDKALTNLDLHFEDKGDGSRTYMGDRCIENDIRTLTVSNKVSPIAAVPEVREYVDERLREAGSRKRVVMDGRDIGTTVFPDAELKLFMTADPLIRAERRMKELKAKGEKTCIEDVLRNIKERDFIDSHREVSPLTRAEDAIVLDNSRMTMDQQMDWIRNLLTERFGAEFQK